MAGGEVSQAKQQAPAPESQPFGSEAFVPGDETVVRWLGMAGFVITSHGVSLALDPVLSGFDPPLLGEPPTHQRPAHGRGHPDPS